LSYRRGPFLGEILLPRHPLCLRDFFLPAALPSRCNEFLFLSAENLLLQPLTPSALFFSSNFLLFSRAVFPFFPRAVSSLVFELGGPFFPLSSYNAAFLVPRQALVDGTDSRDDSTTLQPSPPLSDGSVIFFL